MNNTDSSEQERRSILSRRKFIAATVAGLTLTGLSAALYSLVKPLNKV